MFTHGDFVNAGLAASAMLFAIVIHLGMKAWARKHTEPSPKPNPGWPTGYVPTAEAWKAGMAELSREQSERTALQKAIAEKWQAAFNALEMPAARYKIEPVTILKNKGDFARPVLAYWLLAPSKFMHSPVHYDDTIADLERRLEAEPDVQIVWFPAGIDKPFATYDAAEDYMLALIDPAKPTLFDDEGSEIEE